jgi:cystathionine beta-synthase
MLLAVAENSEHFNDPVRTAMVTELTEIDVGAPVADLMPIFARDFVAIVKSGDKFLGLITRVDLLNHLRRVADR